MSVEGGVAYMMSSHQLCLIHVYVMSTCECECSYKIIIYTLCMLSSLCVHALSDTKMSECCPVQYGMQLYAQ